MIGGERPGLPDFTNIAQSNIPISTVVPTHHVIIFNTHLLNNFFRRFDLISHFLVHRSAEGLHYSVQSPCCREVGPIYTFSKFLFFQKKIWALFPPPGVFALHFRIPLLKLLIPIFFSHLSTFCTLPSSGYPPSDDRHAPSTNRGDDRHAPSTNRGDQPTARRPYMANILYCTLNFTSTVY